MESHLLGLYSKDLRGSHGWIGPPLGGPLGCGRPHEGLSLGAPLVPWLHLYAVVKDFIHVHFGFYCKTTLPLGFPINKGGGATLHTHSFSHTSAMHDLASPSLPAK
jgi:hypothetical protein